MATIAKPIFMIRDVIKNIQFDARDEKVPQAVLKRFLHCVENVADVRLDRKVTYPLQYILLLAFLAVMAGADGWADIAAFSEVYKTKLNGILPRFKETPVPSHDTFRRVMGLLEPSQFQSAVAAFMLTEISQIKNTLGIVDNGLRLICIDGKEQKGTGRKYNTDQKVRNLQTLHCFDASNGICLASVPISEKTNEIPTAQDLLLQMQLKGCVVTFDAMNTQKNTVSAITKSKGDYVGGLKGNQHTFYDEVVLFFTDDTLEGIRKSKNGFRSYTEKAHNRIEKRSYYMSTAIKWFADLPLWDNLKSFVCYIIETEDLVTGKKTAERRYYISSLKDVELCSDAIRGHWSVENQLHWHLDVTFSEDDNTTMDKNAFNNLSILNKMVLTLLRLIQPIHKVGLKIIKKKIGWDLISELTVLLSILDEEVLADALQKSVINKKLKK